MSSIRASSTASNEADWAVETSCWAIQAEAVLLVSGRLFCGDGPRTNHPLMKMLRQHYLSRRPQSSTKVTGNRPGLCVAHRLTPLMRTKFLQLARMAGSRLELCAARRLIHTRRKTQDPGLKTQDQPDNPKMVGPVNHRRSSVKSHRKMTPSHCHVHPRGCAVGIKHVSPRRSQHQENEPCRS